jgi:hypothetical protein
VRNKTTRMPAAAQPLHQTEKKTFWVLVRWSLLAADAEE